MTRGFTLIEAVVVLFIVAVAAALTAPAITRGMDALRTRAEIGGLATFLRHAREQAIARRETHEVRLDPEARTLVLTAAGSERHSASRRLSIPARIHADPPSALTVRFTPEGLSTGARFTLEVPGERPYVVTVEALTGRVTNQRLN